MYKLLIVDDEEIEREGMVHFIPWADYDVDLVGSAWNGVEGYEKIEKLQPDIVLTDIKMPVMNGIELIRKTKIKYPDIEFVVLSGYGEYEFTSQAMEEGVRHYVLKPCDEEKIVMVLNKAKAEIDKKRAKIEKEREANKIIHRLMPRAREQVFRSYLLGRKPMQKDYQSFLKEYEAVGESVRLVAMRSDKKIDELEQFIFENVFSELLGAEKVLLSTVIQKSVLFMIEEKELDVILEAVNKTTQELDKMFDIKIIVAISNVGEVDAMPSLYEQILELFRIGEEEKQVEILHYDMFQESKQEAAALMNYKKIEQCKNYVDVLVEVKLMFMKMELKGYDYKKKEEICNCILKILYGKSVVISEYSNDKAWELYRSVLEMIVQYQKIDENCSKEKQRVEEILLAIFRYIRMPELNIQFLAKEVLFMNEDYLGRIFVRNQKIKFSTFLLEQRIYLATQLLQYNPDLKISVLAEMTGYSSDGQYFSKMFRKVTGESPTEYREKMKKRQNIEES